MKAVMPGARLGAHVMLLAEPQPPYTAVPASVNDDGDLVMTEWELTDDELASLLCGARLRLWTVTHGEPFQSVSMEITEPPTDQLANMRES